MARKQAQQIARNLLSGHCSLIAWWTLRHAGVLEAMVALEREKGEGLVPLVHAARTNMAPEVLEALLEYLGTAGLVVMKKGGVFLTSEGKALWEHEDGILELLRAYEPVLEASEHLLARLKTNAPTGVRKSEALTESQAKRYGEEVYGAVAEVVGKEKLAHVLDICCGTGELLVHLAKEHKRVVGVGMGADALAVRRANKAITEADLEKRLIAVPANPVDVCVETQRTFDRIGISRQLWKSIDCVIATNLFAEMTGRPEEVGRILAGVPKNFPGANLVLIEAVSSAKFEKNYYAAELNLLLRLAHSVPWTVEKWREVLRKAGYGVKQEVGLVTDGLVVFVCKGT